MKLWSVGDLEQLKTHELADLQGNLSLVLRRMPDVPLAELEPEPRQLDGSGPATAVRREKPGSSHVPQALPTWIEGE